MFQYTKENILNKVEAGKTFKVEGGKLIVDGLGEYVLANIVDGKIFRTECEPGSEGTLTIDATKITGAGEYVLTFRVVTSQALAEFASPNWNVFGKPVIIGFKATKASDVDAVLNAVKLAFPAGNTAVTVVKSGTDVIITGVSKYISFDKEQLVKVEEGENGIEETVVSGAVETDPNVEPFGTKEWIIENLRFPTYPNIRYNSAGNMPTAERYDELSFAYAVPRVGLGGLSGVGQGLTAVTRHIFYVPAGTITTLKNGETELLDSAPSESGDLDGRGELDTDNE